MKVLATVALLLAGAQTAVADGYVMGSGRWTCDRVTAAADGTDLEKGQVFGWIMGVWSQETFHREVGFIDTVEKVGGLRIVELTIQECGKASGETPLFRVVQGMMANTK
ncbi:MAG: 5'-methylthioadenosine phosphorylase [Pseudomonadota bacterium]